MGTNRDERRIGTNRDEIKIGNNIECLLNTKQTAEEKARKEAEGKKKNEAEKVAQAEFRKLRMKNPDLGQPEARHANG